VTENSETVLLKPWVECALAAERLRMNSYRSIINKDMAAFIVRRWVSQEPNGIVFFFVDENRQILSFYVHPVTSPLRGPAPVHILDEKNLMKVTVINACKLV
jgi:hypothetical protein